MSIRSENDRWTSSPDVGASQDRGRGLGRVDAQTELRRFRRGAALTAARPETLFRLVDDPRATRSDVPVLGYGGSVDVLVERFSPKHREFPQAYVAAHETDRSSIVTWVVERSHPSRIGVRRAAWTEGDASEMLDGCPGLACEALLAGRSLQGPFKGDRLALAEYVSPMTRLVILGAGDDVKPVCALGRSLGWHATVADRRARLATRERSRDADQLVVGDWGTVLRSITFTPRKRPPRPVRLFKGRLLSVDAQEPGFDAELYLYVGPDAKSVPFLPYRRRDG